MKEQASSLILRRRSSFSRPFPVRPGLWLPFVTHVLRRKMASTASIPLCSLLDIGSSKSSRPALRQGSFRNPMATAASARRTRTKTTMRMRMTMKMRGV